MNTREVLEAVRDGNMSTEEALVKLKTAPFVELRYAKADTHRRIRQGSTEVV